MMNELVAPQLPLHGHPIAGGPGGAMVGWKALRGIDGQSSEHHQP